MSAIKGLLPENSDTYETALAEAADHTLPVPYADILNPELTPTEWLPLLAAHESVDLWFEDWTDERKREMIADSLALSKLIGTRAAAQRFLDYVDTEIIHKVSYPQKFPVGRIAVRLTPVFSPEFVARFLLKVTLYSRKNAVCTTRTAVGKAHVKPIDKTPMERAKLALVLSKASDTEYSVNFAHRLPITLDDIDSIDLDAGYVLGAYKDRIRL